MNQNAIARIVADRTGTDMDAAFTTAQSLQKVHPDLQPVVDAWLEGKEEPFEFQGITLEAIKEKESCSHLAAILRMRLLMTSQALVAGYPNWKPVNKDWRR